MATYTENLELFKYDPEVDKKKTFNISQGLNQNWDKLDATVGELQSANNADTDLSNLTATGQAKFDEKVSKSGDTMTGDLQITTSNNPRLIYKNTSFDNSYTTDPSSNVVLDSTAALDKNNVCYGYTQTVQRSNGRLTRDLGVCRSIDGTLTYGSINVQIDASGNLYTYAPNCSTNNSILTTAAMQKANPGYVKLGNGIIIQWGYTAQISINSSTTVTFPCAFTANNYSVSCGVMGSNGAYSPVFGVHAYTTTSFTASLGRVDNSGGAARCAWVAIGY